MKKYLSVYFSLLFLLSTLGLSVFLVTDGRFDTRSKAVGTGAFKRVSYQCIDLSSGQATQYQIVNLDTCQTPDQIKALAKSRCLSEESLCAQYGAQYPDQCPKNILFDNECQAVASPTQAITPTPAVTGSGGYLSASYRCVNYNGVITPTKQISFSSCLTETQVLDQLKLTCFREEALCQQYGNTVSGQCPSLATFGQSCTHSLAQLTPTPTPIMTPVLGRSVSGPSSRVDFTCIKYWGVETEKLWLNYPLCMSGSQLTERVKAECLRRYPDCSKPEVMAAGQCPYLVTGGSACVIEPVTGPSMPAIRNPVKLYVSLSGNDSSPGTLGAPVRTVARAQALARVLSGQAAGDTEVLLRGGVYRLTEPLVFNSEDSGKNGYRVTYQSYPGETAVLSGGKLITGWVVDGNKWKAPVSSGTDSRQLFVNNRRAIRARSPGGFVATSKDATGILAVNPLGVASLVSRSGVELVFKNEWVHSRCPIVSANSSRINLASPCWNRMNIFDFGNRWLSVDWIENAYELLDSPGEWYLDKSVGMIYYLPRQGENLTTSEIVMPVLENLVVGVGTAQAPIANVSFKDLVFSHTTWLKPGTSDGYPQQLGPVAVVSLDTNQGVFVSSKDAAAAYFKYSSNVRFDSNRFIHLGAGGVHFGSGSKQSVINGNSFTDISGTAVVIGEEVVPASVNDEVRGAVISNNYITEIGVDYKGAVGVWLGFTKDSQVIHNEIRDVPYTGINIGWAWQGALYPNASERNLVASNKITNAVYYLSDGGAIYGVASQKGTKIKRNVVFGQQKPTGAIYLDEGLARYFEVSENVISTDAAPLFVKGLDHQIRDNFFKRRQWYDLVFTSAIGCGDGTSECGTIVFEYNRRFDDLKEVPAYILDGAGIEPSYSGVRNVPGGI